MAFDRLLLDGLNRGAEGPQGYRSYLRTLGRYRPAPGTAYDDPLWEQWASKVLHGFEDFQLLCAVRRGAWGVEGLNERVDRLLNNAGKNDAQHHW